MSDLRRIAQQLLGKEFEWYGRAGRYDCFGLCWEAMRLAGMKIPDYGTRTEPEKIDEYIAKCLARDWQLVEAPEPGCVVLLSLKRPFVNHMGLMIDDRQFLHILPRRRSCIEKINSPQWKHRVMGFAKYVGSQG